MEIEQGFVTLSDVKTLASTRRLKMKMSKGRKTVFYRRCLWQGGELCHLNLQDIRSICVGGVRICVNCGNLYDIEARSSF